MLNNEHRLAITLFLRFLFTGQLKKNGLITCIFAFCLKTVATSYPFVVFTTQTFQRYWASITLRTKDGKIIFPVVFAAVPTLQKCMWMCFWAFFILKNYKILFEDLKKFILLFCKIARFIP